MRPLSQFQLLKVNTKAAQLLKLPTLSQFPAVAAKAYESRGGKNVYVALSAQSDKRQVAVPGQVFH